jgi:hypothetical protein
MHNGEYKKRGSEDRTFYILSYSQAAIKVLNNFQILSKIFWNCHQLLVKLAEHNRVRLVRVPGRMRIDGNEITEHLSREGSSHTHTGPEPASGMSARVARGVIRDWMNRKREERWQSICGQRQAKGRLKNCVLKKVESC